MNSANVILHKKEDIDISDELNMKGINTLNVSINGKVGLSELSMQLH